MYVLLKVSVYFNADSKYWFGRVSLRLIQSLLPSVLLRGSQAECNVETENQLQDQNAYQRRLCCICGPILFMKEAQR